MQKVTPGTTVEWETPTKYRATQIKSILLIACFPLLLLIILVLINSPSKIIIKASMTDKKEVSSPKKEGERIFKTIGMGAAIAAPIAKPPTRYAPRIISAKEKAYIDRFLKVAQQEQQKFGIPASIKLAQGLLESNKGQSKLSIKANNHFGVKENGKGISYYGCNSKGQDCAHYKVYRSAWASYRDHSKRLSGKRYRHLKDYGIDYKKWAYGLKKAGYATDALYAEKLIRLIQELSLYGYDK